MTTNTPSTTLINMLTCLLLFTSIVLSTALAVFFFIESVASFKKLQDIRMRLRDYKAQIREMDVESSMMKAKLDVMLRTWKEDIVKQTRNQHASVRVGEREASRLRTAVERSCVRIEQILEEFGWLLNEETKDINENEGEVEDVCH